MYTATINSKEFIDGALKVSVQFSDGTTTVTESCIPQNYDGLKHWVRSRLETFNSGKDIDGTLNLYEAIDPNEPVKVVPTPTAAEVARQAWFENYYKWLKVKETLIDTGILTGNETKAAQLKAKVTADFLPAYLDYL
jgi:hypothetical protein